MEFSLLISGRCQPYFANNIEHLFQNEKLSDLKLKFSLQRVGVTIFQTIEPYASINCKNIEHLFHNDRSNFRDGVPK